MLLDGSQQVLSVGEDGKAASHLLHGLFVQLRLGQSRGLLILNTTGLEEKGLFSSLVLSSHSGMG